MNKNIENSNQGDGGKAFITTVFIGFLAAGCATVTLLALLDKLPTWGYWFIIPGLLLFFLEIKVSSGLTVGGERKVREGLINKKLIKKSNPGYSFTMKKSDDFKRGNYYLAAGDETLYIIDFGTAYKLRMKVNYNNIKSFKLIDRRRTSTFVLELKNGKIYKLYKPERLKFLLKLQSFVNFIGELQKHTKVEGLK